MQADLVDLALHDHEVGGQRPYRAPDIPRRTGRPGHAMMNSDTSLQIMTHLGKRRDASMVSCGR